MYLLTLGAALATLLGPAVGIAQPVAALVLALMVYRGHQRFG